MSDRPDDDAGRLQLVVSLMTETLTLIAYRGGYVDVDLIGFFQDNPALERLARESTPEQMAFAAFQTIMLAQAIAIGDIATVEREFGNAEARYTAYQLLVDAFTDDEHR